MFSLEKVKQTVDTEELASHLSIILEKLEFIIKNQEKLSLTPEIQHSIHALLEKSIPEVFDNYLSFPIEYRNKTSVHDGLTLKDLLVKQLTEITYQVNTIEKVAFQNNEILALAQLKQLESHTLHNNDFETENQKDVKITTSFNYDEYLLAQKEQIRVSNENKLKKEQEAKRVATIEAEKTHNEYEKMKAEYPYQFESADKYSQSSLDKMLADNITNFSNIDDINFDTKYTIRIDPKNVHLINIHDVIRKNVVNPKLKFAETIKNSAPIITPKAEFYNPAPVSSSSVGVLTLPNGNVMNMPIPKISTNISVKDGKKVSKIIGTIASMALFALVTWAACNKPHKDHTQEYALLDAQKTEMIHKLNAQFGTVTNHYRATETGAPYTVVFKGYDPIILNQANVSVVGGYRDSSRGYFAMIKYNNQYYSIASGTHEGGDGFEVETVTNNLIVLQRYKSSF
jgi:hypothetical protein